MKKAIIIMEVLMLTFSIAGCGVREMFMNEEEKTDRECKYIVDILDKRDGESIKYLFTNKAQKETSDIDIGIEYLLDVYKGKSIKIESTGSGSITEYNKGKHSREIDAYYRIQTDIETYFLYFNYWPTNTIDPEMEGIYALGIIREGEEETQVEYHDKNMGIYYPGRQTEQSLE